MKKISTIFPEDIPNSLFLNKKKKKKYYSNYAVFEEHCMHRHTRTQMKWKGKITGIKFCKDLFPTDWIHTTETLEMDTGR